MTEYLRVDTAGRAVEVVQVPDGMTPADLMHPDLAAMCHPRGDAEIGWTRAGDGTWQPPAEPEVPPPGPTITSKADLFRRCTDAEAEAIETALMSLSVRKRRIFEGAAYIASDDPDFDDLRTAAVEMFGEARAAELLAPSA